MAFYALNVHSEVGRRWKRDKAAVFRLFLRRGGFAARSFVFRQGTEREDAPFAPLVPRGMRSVDADRERENPLSAEGTTRGPPWFRRVTSPFRYLYLLRNFFAREGAP